MATIRIKRSTGSSAPSSLANAELAFAEGNSTLYIGVGTGGAGGSATTVAAIGGTGAFLPLSGTATASGTYTFSGGVTFSSSVALGASATATTPASEDDSTAVATTAWVLDRIGAFGAGTVTSVALSLPNLFSVSGSPVTSTGTLTATLSEQAANAIFAGPTTGSNAAPTFRSLVAADIPDLSGSYLTVTTASTTYAPIDSPTFTGTPAAPTAAAGTNSTQVATTAYVDGAVAAIVDTAPEALNTLNELAAALGDDANFATSISTSLGEKLVKASNLSDLTDASAARTNLGLVIGTDVQAYDAELAALAGLTSASDKVPYFTGSGTASVADFTTFGRSLVDDADAAAGRSTLGLGSIATQAANDVTITGGTISGATIDGGTFS
jgi:hypothetical protein